MEISEIMLLVSEESDRWSDNMSNGTLTVIGAVAFFALLLVALKFMLR